MIRNRWLAVTFVFFAALTAAAPSSAEVIAEFVGGGSAAAPVTDVTDAYFGMEGGGWAGGWAEIKTATTFTVATDDASPLHADAGSNVKYLDLAVQSNSTSIKYGVVERDFSVGVDITLPHSIDFKYRVDEDILNSPAFEDFNDRYQIFDGPTGDNTAASSSSWGISVYGGTHTELPEEKVDKWIVFNGGGHDATPDASFQNARNINTGITVTGGVIYDFHIDVDPATYTWDVTIGSGGTTLYDSKDASPNGLGWRTTAAAVGGVVHFNGCTDYDGANLDTREYSFDALRIVPEPSAILLIVSAVLAMVVGRRPGR